MRRAVDAVSITLLTGFLGAGKTTLLNRLLAADHGRRVAVIVNEFGELGIDAALVRNATDTLVELANGCICCATKGDFARSVQEVLAASRDVESLLIETSGLADPAPVMMDLEGFRFVRDIRLDGVVTVIDAENFDRNLDNAEAAYQQIVCGDILMINKVDLVAAGIPDLIEAGLGRLNPGARVLRTVSCDAPLDVVLGPARTPGRAPGHGHGSHTHDEFVSASLTLADPLDRETFARWLEDLPGTVFRVKGFVRFAGEAQPHVVHCVGERRSIGPAPDGVDPAGAALVLIGRGIERERLLRSLEECVAAPMGIRT